MANAPDPSEIYALQDLWEQVLKYTGLTLHSAADVLSFSTARDDEDGGATSTSAGGATPTRQPTRKQSLALRIQDAAQHTSALIGTVSSHSSSLASGGSGSMELDLLGTCSNSLRRALLSFIALSSKVSSNPNNHVMRDEHERAARDLLLRSLDVIDLASIIRSNAQDPRLGVTSGQGVGLRVFLHTANALADAFEDLLQKASESNSKTMATHLNGFAQHMASFQATLQQFAPAPTQEISEMLRLALAVASEINHKAVVEPVTVPSASTPSSSSSSSSSSDTSSSGKKRRSSISSAVASTAAAAAAAAASVVPGAAGGSGGSGIRSSAMYHSTDDEELLQKEIERTRERLSDLLLSTVLTVHRTLNGSNAFVQNLAWLVRESQTNISNALEVVCIASYRLIVAAAITQLIHISFIR